MRHLYEIQMNHSPAGKNKNKIVYDFANTQGITILLEKDAAQVSFTLTVEKQFEDIVNLKPGLVPDALRKTQLMHAVIYGTELVVDKITVSIDGESRIFDNETPFFPFLFCILPKNDFDHDNTWNKPELKHAILSTTKSDANSDSRFSAMYAFLGAMSKKFEIDRFSALWTSMNAFYNYVVAVCNEEDQMKKDAERIGFLLKMLECGEKKSARGCRRDYKKEYEKVGTCLRGLSLSEIEKLCTALKKHRQMRQVIFKNDCFAPINELSQKLSITPYGLMLLEYPYYCRCRYIHGERATLLFSGYNDREISVLRCLNYILTDFLRRNIPVMFQNNFILKLKDS